MNNGMIYKVGTVIFGIGMLGVVIPDLLIIIVKAMPSIFGEMSKQLASRDLAKDLWLAQASNFFNDYGSLVGVAGALIGSLGFINQSKGEQPADPS